MLLTFEAPTIRRLLLDTAVTVSTDLYIAQTIRCYQEAARLFQTVKQRYLFRYGSNSTE